MVKGDILVTIKSILLVHPGVNGVWCPCPRVAPTMVAVNFQILHIALYLPCSHVTTSLTYVEGGRFSRKAPVKHKVVCRP